MSSNWRDDYLIKLAEYEVLGIPEYWIVDYQGLDGTRYIGRLNSPRYRFTLWLRVSIR